MDPLGAAMNIASILRRAYALYEACKSAASEFKTASRHVKSMALAIEVVNADLIQNRRSVLHQGTATSSAKLSKLKTLIRSCNDDLQKLERLFTEYRRSGGIGWALGGRGKVIEVQADLMMSTTALNTFLASQGLDVLGRMEDMLREMMKRMQLGQVTISKADLDRKRKLAGTLIASLFICRMKRASSFKRRNISGKKITSKPLPKPKLKTAVSWKTKPDMKRRETLLGDFVRSTLADPSYGGGGSAESTEHFECWRVGKASTSLTPGVYGAVRHKRGQLELAEMAKTFQKVTGNRVVSRSDGSVKHLLRLKRKSEYQWEFVAGRTESREVSGAIINGRDMIIIKRSRRH
jgi:hypothetical protein